MGSRTKKPNELPPPAEVYVVVNPITYGDPEVRREAGEEVTDIPAAALPWLLAQGHVSVKGDN